MKRFLSVLIALLMLTTSISAGAAIEPQSDYYDCTGERFSDLELPYLEEGGLPSEDFFVTDEDISSHKLTFINLWDTNCYYCMLEMPHLKRLYEEYSSRGLFMVGVCYNKIQGGNYADEYNYPQTNGTPYPIVQADMNINRMAAHNAFVPQSFLVDGNGGIIEFIPGAYEHYEDFAETVEYWLDLMDSGEVYTVTFMDGATGEVIEAQSVPAGYCPIFPEAPVHEGHSFDGWSATHVGGVTEDMTITANYTASRYRVRFYDSITGDMIAKVFVDHGQPAPAPEAPEHEGYVFVGWDQDISCITHAIDVHTVYQPAGGIMGDVDGNGVLTANDALAIMRYTLGLITLSDEAIALADVDGNGSITANDALYVMRLTLGLIG